MRRLIETGYQAVYVTDHDAVWSDEELKELRRQFPALGIFPGIELAGRLSGPQHLLVLGTNDPKYLRMDGEADVLAAAADDGHLTVLAHPYRWPGGADMVDRGLWPDALEFLTHSHQLPCALHARIVAEHVGLALVNSGDVHSLDMVNRFWVETDQPLKAADDIRRTILDGTYRNCDSQEQPES